MIYSNILMRNPTFAFWKQYIDMVSTILLFIRADRAGDWNLHLLTFKEMLPLMMLYDHINYARWGAVYLLDLLLLENTAQEVHAEFIAGNFVVKRAAGSFNQISADQALEHIIKKGENRRSSWNNKSSKCYESVDDCIQ